MLKDISQTQVMEVLKKVVVEPTYVWKPTTT